MICHLMIIWWSIDAGHTPPTEYVLIIMIRLSTMIRKVYPLMFSNKIIIYDRQGWELK